MEFTCHTTYNQKALTVMARAVRKTVRAERSRTVRYYGWIIAGLLAVSLWLSWGTPWQMVLSCVVITALLLVHWKEDAINGYFAKRKALPGTDFADTRFCPDHYLVKTAAAESKWQYDKILALAETREYIVLVLGMHHTMALEKAALKGGSLPQFCRFLEEKTGHKMQNIGG
ncbi:YcxB family protein [Candidatus Avoscillospira sp. LCP25S3_F1]|uniref:YcxB family protein n=1 Tax=Candidatus Avoscillospira sp. LCP25S3_F1 TaxID=3438825 RepID=UPI003F91D630